MSTVRVPVIGIVGGIGSGKSALAKSLTQHFRCCHLDADGAGHRVLKRRDVRDQLGEIFGSEIFDQQGEIIRSVLASKVFGASKEHQISRSQLEKVVHPLIHQELTEQLGRFQQDQNCDVVLLDAAVMLEAGWSEICDAIVFVDVPEEERIRRVHQRGWSTEEFHRREASQLSLEQKKQFADFVVDNSQELSVASQSLANWIQNKFQHVS